MSNGNHQKSFHLGHNERLTIQNFFYHGKVWSYRVKTADFPVFQNFFRLIFLISSVLLDWFSVKNGLIFSWQSVWPLLAKSQWNQYLFRGWVIENGMFYLLKSQWKSVNPKKNSCRHPVLCMLTDSFFNETEAVICSSSILDTFYFVNLSKSAAGLRSSWHVFFWFYIFFFS